MDNKKFTSKHGARILWILTTLLLIMVCMPLTALADRSLSFESLIIDARVLPDASMQVTEAITIKFNGQWHGFNVEIPQGNTPLENVMVSEPGQEYTFNPGTEYGPPGTYLIKHRGDNVMIDWSIDALDQTRTFYLSYRVINAVTIHNDVAELYRKFVGDANELFVGDVEVNIKLPPGHETYKQGEDIRIWGHGPLNGNVSFAEDNTILLKIKDLSPHTYLEGRVVIPSALFTSAPEGAYSNKAALEQILAEEQAWADKANKERSLAKAQIGGAIAIVIGSLLGVFVFWRRYGRKHKTTFNGDYYRDLPASYSPAELSVLWNFKKVNTRDFTATILDLARRKFLYLEEETVETRKMIGKKEVSTYRLSFKNHPNPAEFKNPKDATLRSHEKELIDYLKNTVGNGQDYIHFTDIENYAKKHGTAFNAFWQKWTTGVIEQSNKHKFFESNEKAPTVMTFIGIALFLLGGLFIYLAGPIGFGICSAGGIFFLAPLLFKRRSLTGQEDYVRWAAFKKFLQHFSDMEKHEIPSLIIWEHYLVYAVTLDVAKEVIKQLELVFPNMEDGDYRFGSGWMYYGAYRGMDSLTNSFDSMNSSIEKSLSTAQKAASAASSGSGGGGGFSGGGGFGGGGGSYGGR